MGFMTRLQKAGNPYQDKQTSSDYINASSCRHSHDLSATSSLGWFS